MKLPKLSEAKHYKLQDTKNGEDVTTDVKVSSQFDELPAWFQWSCLGAMLVFLLIAVSLVSVR